MTKARVGFANILYHWTKGKSRTSTRLVHYIAYGEKSAERQVRTIWADIDGVYKTTKEVSAWAKEKAKSTPIAYRMVLSAQTEPLGLAEFLQAFQTAEQKCGYLYSQHNIQMGLHTDTDNHHVHVLAFADQRIGRADFLKWNNVVKKELVALEKAMEKSRTEQKQKHKEEEFEL